MEYELDCIGALTCVGCIMLEFCYSEFELLKIIKL